MRWGLYQGASVGNSARDAYLRELDSIVLPRFAARVRRACHGVRVGAGEAVRLPEGVSDARRPRAPRQEASPGPGRFGVEDRQRRGRHVAVDALRDAAGATARRCVRSRWTRRWSRRRAARFGRRRSRRSCTTSCSAATAARARTTLRLDMRRPRHREGPPPQERASAVGADSGLSTPRRSSKRSPAPACSRWSSSSPTRNGSGATGAGLPVASWPKLTEQVTDLYERRLHQRLGRDPQRPRDRAVLDRRAIRRRTGDPRRTDLAAARHVEDRRRQHVAGRARNGAAAG